MQPIETQPNIPPQMTPDEAAASLAFATQLSQGIMPKNASEMPKIDPGQEKIQEMIDDKDSELEGLKKQFEDFKKETKKSQKEQIEELKTMIKEVLSEDEEENEEE